MFVHQKSGVIVITMTCVLAEKWNVKVLLVCDVAGNAIKFRESLKGAAPPFKPRLFLCLATQKLTYVSESQKTGERKPIQSQTIKEI